VERPKRHSITRLNTFAEICERRYALECFEPWKDTPDSLRGKAIHDALETMIVAYLVDHCGWEAALNKALESDYTGLVKIRVQHALERVLPILKHTKPIATEEWFEGEIRADFCGKIDYVSASTPVTDATGKVIDSLAAPCILDFKTLKPGKSGLEVWQARRTLQLRAYAAVKGINTAGYVYIPWTDPAYVTLVRFSDAELDATERWIDAQCEVINRRWAQSKDKSDLSQWALSAPGHFLCNDKWCPFWSQCLGKEERNESA
jgi:hypothetical protein